MQGFKGFESWDETYVHTKHNTENRTVLEMRDTEPYTWVRTQGKGAFLRPGDMMNGRGAILDFRIWLSAESAGRPAIGRWGRSRSFHPSNSSIKNSLGICRGRSGGNRSGLLPMQLPVTPEESMKYMVVPQGFSIHLFASDPAIHKPICMAWDERAGCG